MSKHSLILHDVHKWYKQGSVIVQVLNGITVTFAQNQTYAIVGASGSGKSTLLHAAAGLDNVSRGSVCFDECAIELLTDDQKSIFLNKSIGLVFQYPYLIKELSVLENVMLKELIAGEHKALAEQKAADLLVNVGLADKIKAFPGQLSGGQQQRVALARALINRPHFLLADEPTGSLDMHTGQAIIDLILQLQEAWHMGIIISSHDDYVTNRMHTVYELKDGLLRSSF